MKKDQLRKASQADSLPYRVTRKYGEPRLYGTLGDVRTLVLADLSTCLGRAERIGTQADLDRIAEAKNAWTELLVDGVQLPMRLKVLVDEYYGVHYDVFIEDRRHP